MGAGPIGLFHLQVALLSGARAVIVSQPSAERRAHAERLGATATVDPRSEDLAAVVRRVMHAGGGSQQARLRLVLAVRGKRHPEMRCVDVVRHLFGSLVEMGWGDDKQLQQADNKPYR